MSRYRIKSHGLVTALAFAVLTGGIATYTGIAPDGGGAGGGEENAAPAMAALDDVSGFANTAIAIECSCTDDGLPAAPGVVSYQWTQTVGSGTCTFGDDTDATTTATCDAEDTYTIECECSDGELTDSDTLTASVAEERYLDQLSVGANVCWCPSDQLAAAYTGPLLEVQRTSDTTNQDIDAQADGDVDLTALDAFCTGTECNVTTLYDPSGNARDLVQTTADRMPTVYEAGAPVTCGTAGKLCMDFDGVTGSEDFLARADASGFTGNPDITIAFSTRADDPSADNTVIAVGPGSSGQGYYFIFFPAVARATNSQLNGVRQFTHEHVTSTYQYFISGKAAGAGIGASTLEHDGVAQTEFGVFNGANTTNITNTNTSVGAFNAGSFGLDGRIGCGCIFNAVLAGDDLTATRSFFGAHN